MPGQLMLKWATDCPNSTLFKFGLIQNILVAFIGKMVISRDNLKIHMQIVHLKNTNDSIWQQYL